MSRKIVLRPLVEVDLLEGIDWYEAKQPGLGVVFLEEVQATLDRIEGRPNLYAVVFQDCEKRSSTAFHMQSITQWRATPM